MENRHHAIGATGKGCSVAITDKIRYRGKGGKTFLQWLESGADTSVGHYPNLGDFKNLQFMNTEKLVNNAYDNGAGIQLEGTQGALLDLHLGPYPFTTHKQTGAAQWLMEVGLSPNLRYDIVLVMRTYPIRVAGNSGPMPGEIRWTQLAREINSKLWREGKEEIVEEGSLKQFEQACKEIAADKWEHKEHDGWMIERWDDERRNKNREMVSELHKLALEAMSGPVLTDLMNLFETTTVTKKLRRVAMMDPDLTRTAIRQNRPTRVIITFMNYLMPECWGSKDHSGEFDRIKWCNEWGRRFGVAVSHYTTERKGDNLIQCY